MAISGTRLFGGRSARHLAQSAREQHELDLVPAIIGTHDGNQAQSRAQQSSNAYVPQSEAITMEIKRHPMARSEAIRSGALEITMAINLARSRSRAHPSKSRTICAATESCASVSTCGERGGGRRSEHLHVGTHVRVGEHPKQIGLAQPLARAAP